MDIRTSTSTRTSDTSIRVEMIDVDMLTCDTYVCTA
jgi:hypothetical protein